MHQWLFAPPIAFMIVLFVVWALERIFRRLSFSCRNTAGSRESYACGEDNYDQMAQPDYSNFFPFAFFFTLAHVATLIMATVPVETFKSFVLALFYIAGATVGLIILLKD